MSFYSDYEHGCIDDFEYRQACASENRKARYEEEHLYDEDEGLSLYDEDEIKEMNLDQLQDALFEVIDAREEYPNDSTDDKALALDNLYQLISSEIQKHKDEDQGDEPYELPTEAEIDANKAYTAAQKEILKGYR